MSDDETKDKSFFETVREGVRDVTTLDVVTLSGKIEINTDANTEVDLGTICDVLSKQISQTTSAIDVVAFTRVQLDSDTVQFVQSDLTEADRFSAGVLLLELALHPEPLPAVLDRLEGGEAVASTIPSGLEPAMSALIRRLLSADPQRRTW